MARLNDTAAPIDPVELLRRKYSRQNKEIARINSTQCIRIRNLENEVSRLLTENLDLREQILHLQTEAETTSSQGAIDHINSIKANLEAKLLELGKLVTDLGLPQPKRKTSASEGKALRSSPRQSPDQKTWKNTYTLSEAVGLEDGKLPPILEDKCYPRRTLESSEIRDIFLDTTADNTDSPDIGPPPVSQFINEDPLKIDLPKKVNTEAVENSEVDPVRSINLEQRRKRRDSSTVPEQKKGSILEPESSQPGKEVAQSLRTGAKRKLSIREDEDGAIVTKTIDTSPDDFRFARRNTEGQLQQKTSGAVEKSSSKSQREIAIAKGIQREKTNSTAPLNARRALGPKTTNTDVASSPRKSHKQASSDEKSSDRGDNPRKDTSKERPRERKLEPLRIKATTEQAAIASTDIVLDPETPAAPDIFSPAASGSSGIRAESRDTPPPSDLGSGIEGHRPSRRSRGSVSYAEPNLRDKMRRPTKELVDAVTGEGKAQRLSNVKLEGEDPASSVKVKEELEVDCAWKSLPSASMVNEYSKSPLGDKVSPQGEISRVLTTQRHRRRSSIHQTNDNELPRSGSGSAISALLNGPRKYRHEQGERSETKEPLHKAMANLDIYEFTGSSPREPSDSRLPAVKADSHAGRSRRTSSTTEKLGNNKAPSSDGEQTGPAPTALSRRTQAMVGTGASASNIESDGQRQADDRRKPSSHSHLNDSLETRSDRISARRRSMML